MDKNALYGWNEAAKSKLPLLVDADGNLVISEMSSKLDDLIAAVGSMVISLSVMPAGSVTNDMLAATAVTESKTVAKTFTHASLADAAGILGSQLGAGALHQVKASIGHANGTPTIAILPAGAVLIDVWTVCTQTYDATAPTIDIGYSGSATVILPTASIGKTSGNVSGEDESTRGTDLYSTHARRKFYASQTTVIATIAGASGNTTGTMDVYLSYLQTA